jgi:hypothetical protein
METIIQNEGKGNLKVCYSNTNVHINDSYIVGRNDIPTWVERIKSFGEQNGYTYSRSAQSWINEWRAHNLLFKLGVEPSRTRDVDLNEDETTIRKIGYFLLSLLYI